jgi:hypothetical protein
MRVNAMTEKFEDVPFSGIELFTCAASGQSYRSGRALYV